jgi:mRNA interferase MazF
MAYCSAVLLLLTFKSSKIFVRLFSVSYRLILVIVSNDDENKILDTVILMPLSTDLLDDIQPYRVRITKRDNLKQDSDVLINQIRTLSKLRIKEKIATITEEEYQNIIQNLCKNFL